MVTSLRRPVAGSHFQLTDPASGTRPEPAFTRFKNPVGPYIVFKKLIATAESDLGKTSLPADSSWPCDGLSERGAKAIAISNTNRAKHMPPPLAIIVVFFMVVLFSRLELILRDDCLETSESGLPTDTDFSPT